MATTATSTTPTSLQWLVVLAWAINSFGTFYSMTGKLTDGCTISNQSVKYNNLIAPPGWAFSIWGIIFTWELIGCIYAFLPQLRFITAPIVDNQFGLFWGVACLFQAAWPYIFCWSIGTSWFILFSIWLSMLALQQSSLLKLANLPSSTSTQTKVLTYGLLVAPFSLHLGWVTAATALNINVSAVSAVNTPTTLITVALCTLIFVIIMGWTFGVTGLKWTKNSCDPIMAAGVLWALNAVSDHDVTKTITTTEGQTLFKPEVTTTISDAAVFAFYFLGGFLVLRLMSEGIIQVVKKMKKDHQPSSDHALSCVVEYGGMDTTPALQ